MNRRLYRSRTDTVIGGVAAGLANYLNTDPALVRVGWVVLALVTNGVGVLAYLVCWVAIPEEPKVTVEPEIGPDGTPMPVVETAPVERREGRAGVVVGVGLVLLGAWFLVREYLPPVNWNLIWPVVLIGIGALILITSARRRTDA
ncbi:MAG TPA: PspC domain-containing protein [Patescibacteria group bacterium]|nr:PspC domain-containing protein [Patescibacteria group bacterium]